MHEHHRGSRRSFLSWAAITSFCAAIGTALAGIIRLPKPAVLPGPQRIYKLGDPEQFAVGTRVKLETEQCCLFRDEQGFHAISTICTHLGCIIAVQEQGGFACPCHGSRFNEGGEVVGGPAPTGLPWLEISLSVEGQLQVNAEAEVPRGTKFRA